MFRSIYTRYDISDIRRRKVRKYVKMNLVIIVFVGSPESTCPKTGRKSDFEKKYQGHKLDNMVVSTDETVEVPPIKDQYTQGTRVQIN